VLGFSLSGPTKAPIYFCPVGTIFVFSLKMVSTVACCVRLCTKNGWLLISSFFSDTPIGKAPGVGTWRVWVLSAGASRYTGSPFHDGGGPFLLDLSFGL